MNTWVKKRALPVMAASIVMIAGLSGCAMTTGNAAKVEIHGETFYRERIALPSDAILTVQVKDVSKMDVPATVMAEQVTEGASTPAKFSFELGRDQFVEGHTYAIGARITLDGKLLFINTQAYHIDVNSKEPMSVMLEKVGR